MSFINLEYFLFVAVGLVVYYIMPKKIQWVVLLLMSYVYYLSFKVEAVVYIIFTTLVTFAAGLLIEKAETKGKEWLAANKETIDRDQKKAFKAKLKKKKKPRVQDFVIHADEYCSVQEHVIINFINFIFL